VPLETPLPAADLLVNASSLGMTGQPPLRLDLSSLPLGATVYDVVYVPLETELLAAARARGLRAIDGLEMLIGQAAIAFERFFGAAPPRARDAELKALLVGGQG
jgi:shikimate dehydrogenase